MKEWATVMYKLQASSLPSTFGEECHPAHTMMHWLTPWRLCSGHTNWGQEEKTVFSSAIWALSPGPCPWHSSFSWRGGHRVFFPFQIAGEWTFPADWADREYSFTQRHFWALSSPWWPLSVLGQGEFPLDVMIWPKKTTLLVESSHLSTFSVMPAFPSLCRTVLSWASCSSWSRLHNSIFISVADHAF